MSEDTEKDFNTLLAYGCAVANGETEPAEYIPLTTLLKVLAGEIDPKGRSLIVKRFKEGIDGLDMDSFANRINVLAVEPPFAGEAYDPAIHNMHGVLNRYALSLHPGKIAERVTVEEVKVALDHLRLTFSDLRDDSNLTVLRLCNEHDEVLLRDGLGIHLPPTIRHLRGKLVVVNGSTETGKLRVLDRQFSTVRNVNPALLDRVTL